jgi:hypothetical protein
MLRVYSDQNVIVWQKSYLNFVTKMLHKIYLDCIKQNVWVVMVPRTNRILKTKLQTENSDSFSFFCLFDYYSQFLRSTREIEWWTCRLLMIIYSCFWRSNARARKKKFVIASARGVSFECCVCVCVCLVGYILVKGSSSFSSLFSFLFISCYLSDMHFWEGSDMCNVMILFPRDAEAPAGGTHIGPTGRCTIVKSKTQHYSLESIVFIYGLFFKRCRTIHSCVCVARLLITFQGKTRNISQDKNKKEKSVKVEPRYMAEGRIHERENTHTSIHIYNSSTDIFLSSFLVPRWSECV